MNGILLVNKPKDYTSRDIVNIVGKTLNTKKVGHTGTLDPLAQGLLVLCIGKSLKLTELLTNHDKEYIAEVILGYETDTLDVTGVITKEKYLDNITKEDLEKALNSLTGKIKQIVPAYSAIKIKGKKLYEYARNNIKVELPKREIEIYSLELISDIIKNKDNTIEFTVKCIVSKGTYIRSLIRDMGLLLNTYGTMKNLTRTKVGNFNIEKSYTLEQIKNKEYKIINPVDVLELEKVKVDENTEKKIRNGMVLNKFFKNDISMILNKNNELLAIYKVKDKDNTLVKPWKML